jgi:prefoldin subunit 5
MSSDVPIGEYPQPTLSFEEACKKFNEKMKDLHAAMDKAEETIKRLTKENNELRKTLGIEVVDEIITSNDKVKTVTHEDWRKSNGYK